MSENAPIKLFNWKKGLLIFALGFAVVAYRTHESYRNKGHLDSADVFAAVATLAMLIGVIAFVGWWANRRE